MKKLSIILLLITSSCAIVTVEIEDKQKVIETTGTQNELFVKANTWMVETFNNAESVIQFSDKESGIINGRYMLKQTYTYSNYTYIPNGGIYAIIKVEVKDDRSRITIIPEAYTTPENGGNPKLTYSKETALNDINTLISEFETYMTSKTDSDW